MVLRGLARAFVRIPLAVPLAVWPSCVVDDPRQGETDAGSSSSGGSDSTSSTTDPGATSIEPSSSSESTTTSPGGDDTSTTGEPPSFDCPGVSEYQCDPSMQDCPAGF